MTDDLRSRLDELERAIDRTGEPAGLITVLSTHENDGDVEAVPGRPDHVRIDGEVRPLTETARAKLRGWILP